MANEPVHFAHIDWGCSVLPYGYATSSEVGRALLLHRRAEMSLPCVRCSRSACLYGHATTTECHLISTFFFRPEAILNATLHLQLIVRRTARKHHRYELYRANIRRIDDKLNIYWIFGDATASIWRQCVKNGGGFDGQLKGVERKGENERERARKEEKGWKKEEKGYKNRESGRKKDKELSKAD